MSTDQDIAVDDDTLPTPLLTTGLYVAAGALAASFVVAVTSVRTSNGEVVFFRDWGAVGLGAVALLAALGSVPAALSPLEAQHRLKRLAISGGIGLLASYRVLYGLGVFA